MAELRHPPGVHQSIVVIVQSFSYRNSALISNDNFDSDSAKLPSPTHTSGHLNVGPLALTQRLADSSKMQWCTGVGLTGFDRSLEDPTLTII
ncbi:hypothetical protein TWF173_001673 [Orbilia oligospora]|nr:hypothetical protein TWF173_001673 [Orbilia oligospora]